MKKAPGDIILCMTTINNNHRMCGSWDMERDRQNFLSFWTIFCNFTLLTSRKIKNLKKWKKRLYISSFYSSIPKIMITCYSFWDTACDGCNFYFSFWANFLPFYPLTTQKNQNFEKMKNTLKDIIILHMHTKKWCKIIERTDIPIEKVTYKGGCPT